MDIPFTDGVGFADGPYRTICPRKIRTGFRLFRISEVLFCFKYFC